MVGSGPRRFRAEAAANQLRDSVRGLGPDDGCAGPSDPIAPQRPAVVRKELAQMFDDRHRVPPVVRYRR